MTTFQHVSDIGDKLPIASIEDNIKSFLDWGFLNIGGFINVHIPSSGTPSAAPYQLKPMSNPAIPVNTVWSTQRKDWVYESGISYTGGGPISISGIYINNTFVPGPTGNPTHNFHINYPLGQITFSAPKSPNTDIKLNYSYRYIQVYKANESVWWKELQDMSYNPAKFNNSPDFSILANNRVQLPAIIIETISRTYQTPYQLGTTENIITQDILLHVFTENPMQRNNIINILLLQKDKETFLYNLNKVIKNQVFGLNYRGEKNTNGLNYNQLVNNNNYRSNVFYIEDASVSELNQISTSLYNGIVRWSLKIFP